MAQRTKEQTSFIMSRIRSKNTSLERAFLAELDRRGLITYSKNNEGIVGAPDFVFAARKVAVFCDSEFWHGYDWDNNQYRIKTNAEFWRAKIERNMVRDSEVNEKLRSSGWSVLRFWGKEIKENLSYCVDRVESLLRFPPRPPYRTVDLSSGLGGLRRAFELAGPFVNVLSIALDQHGRSAHRHLFHQDPLTTLDPNSLKPILKTTPYDLLLATIPCLPLSRPHPKMDLTNPPKGELFFRQAEIIRLTRPCAFFLESDAQLVTRAHSKTFKIILDVLTNQLQYKLIGLSTHNNSTYYPNSFILNSINFGLPHNRPRAYLIGFDRERFSPDRLNRLPLALPTKRAQLTSHLSTPAQSPVPSPKPPMSFDDFLEKTADPKYYLSSLRLNFLIKRGLYLDSPPTFSEPIINLALDNPHTFSEPITNLALDNPPTFSESITNLALDSPPAFSEPITNLALDNPLPSPLPTASGPLHSPNLVFDRRDCLAGLTIKGKLFPPNDRWLRRLTPMELAKLQGFAGHAFLDGGTDKFSFPPGLTDGQKYKLLANSVTIQVVEQLAAFILSCLSMLSADRPDGL
jgi:DNA (cytosine-5)-methyltransferase 1